MGNGSPAPVSLWTSFFPGHFCAAWSEAGVSCSVTPTVQKHLGVADCRGAVLAAEWSYSLLPCILPQSGIGPLLLWLVCFLAQPGKVCTAATASAFLSEKPSLGSECSYKSGCGCTWCSAGGWPWLRGCCLHVVCLCSCLCWDQPGLSPVYWKRSWTAEE